MLLMTQRFVQKMMIFVQAIVATYALAGSLLGMTGLMCAPLLVPLLAPTWNRGVETLKVRLIVL